MTEYIPFTSRRLQRKAWARDGGHARLHAGHRTGIWNCELEVVTPLCVKSYFVRDKPVMIPGHSLRGMVRGVVEMMGESCGRLKPAPPIPDDLSACRTAQVCVACRVFGFVDREKCLRGKVAFGDSDRIEASWIGVPMPSSEGPEPERPNAGGWRFFAHQPAPEKVGPLACVARGSRFPFRVHYEDLAPEEYSVLRFALTLGNLAGEDALCHKLGYGKELGLGSVTIRIQDDAGETGNNFGLDLRDPAFSVFVAGRRYQRDL